MVNGINTNPNKLPRPDMDGRIDPSLPGQMPLEQRQLMQAGQNIQASLQQLNARNPERGFQAEQARLDGPVGKLEKDIENFLNLAQENPTEALKILNDTPELAQALKATAPRDPAPSSFVTT